MGDISTVAQYVLLGGAVLVVVLQIVLVIIKNKRGS
jgi:hypothetical protein